MKTTLADPRKLTHTMALALFTLVTSFPALAQTQTPIHELPVARLTAALAAGELTSTKVTAAFLERIAAVDQAGPTLNAIIEINPDAKTIAAALDKHWVEHGAKGALHGVPVVLKANIDTGDAMATSAGSLALADHQAQDDAALVARLRAAGAVILGKTNLSEWANFRSTGSSSGWSSVGGQTRNPYVLDRNPCGSSSGSAVAVSAGLAPLAVGTETDGSVICPASANGVVGIKPTLGLISRDGIIPIAHSQDTAGPMASSVWGAAILLREMLSYAAEDPRALKLPADTRLLPNPAAKRLDAKRIGVLRNYPGSGDAAVEAVYTASLKTLQTLGAELVEPLQLTWQDSIGDAEFEVLLYEFKAGLNAYLRQAGVKQDRDTLAELISFNRQHAAQVMPWFQQELFHAAAAKGDLAEDAYQAALAASGDQLRQMLNKMFREQGLAAVVMPSNGPAWKTDWLLGDNPGGVFTSSLAAISGFPNVTVPAGMIQQLPVGLSIVGPALSDAEVIQIAYAFEQATQARRAPTFLPTLER